MQNQKYSTRLTAIYDVSTCIILTDHGCGKNYDYNESLFSHAKSIQYFTFGFESLSTSLYLTNILQPYQCHLIYDDNCKVKKADISK